MALLEKERNRELFALFLAAALVGGLFAACATGDDTLERAPTRGAGLGGSSGDAGGTASTGGTQGPTGGSPGATGGSTGSGGSTGTGGSSGTGGSTGTGGSNGTGGSPGGTGGSSSGTGGTPVSTTLPYSDDFEDGNSNGWVDSKDDENLPLGRWAVVTDGATKVYQEQDVTSDPSWAVGGDYRWVDQRLESKVKFVSGSADGTIMLIVRFTDFKTYCFLEVRTNQMKIRVKVAGSTTDVATYKFPTLLVDGTWYTVGLSIKGSALAAYFNGVQVAAGTNGSVLGGGIALTATDGVIAFDDVSVTLPP